METVTTSDFYEASYYILNNCVVTSIQCLPLNGKVGCKFTCEGEKLVPLQLEYFEGRARVNLLQFRRAYGQISSYAHEARRRWRAEKNLPEQKGGEA